MRCHRLYCVCAFLWAFLNSLLAYAQPLIIPDPEKHAAFLYHDWQPERRNLVVFMDPICPYCKRAIPKLDRIHDYNVFVYWAPVFGARSEQQVAPLFDCEKPTASYILHSFVKSAAVQGVKCEGPYGPQRRALNDAMVAHYQVDAVPAFYMQGTRTSLVQIMASQSQPVQAVPSSIHGVSIDWSRYSRAKIMERVHSRHLAMILPSHIDLTQAQQLIEQHRPEYLFGVVNHRVALCEQIAGMHCEDDQQAADIQRRQLQEIELLLGLKTDDNNNGDKLAGYIVTQSGHMNQFSAIVGAL